MTAIMAYVPYHDCVSDDFHFPITAKSVADVKLTVKRSPTSVVLILRWRPPAFFVCHQAPVAPGGLHT